MRLALLCAAAMAMAAADLAPATAQELLATRSRQSSARQELRTHVSVPRRPDYFVRSAVVICDTRDPQRRQEELNATMDALLAAAETTDVIETAVLRQSGEDVLAIPLNRLDYESNLITGGGRADTSAVRLLIKTPVTEDDLIEDVEQRLEDFRASVPMTGRSEFYFEGQPELSLVDPRQYRTDVIAAIASDANAITDALGEGYGVEVQGLEREIVWYRSDDLELRLFIPHRLSVVPRP